MITCCLFSVATWALAKAHAGGRKDARVLRYLGRRCALEDGDAAEGGARRAVERNFWRMFMVYVRVHGSTQEGWRRTRRDGAEEVMR